MTARGTWHLVTGDYPPHFTGGVSSWTEEVAQALSVRLDGGVVVHARRASPLREWFWDRGAGRVPVVRIPGRHWNRDQAGHVSRHLGGGIQSGDTVLATTWPLAVDLPTLCRKANARLLVIAQGSEVSRLPEETPPVLAALRGVARFGAVSRYLARILERHEIRASVLPAPIRWGEEGPRAGRSGILTVARLTPLKGVDRVLRLGAALGWPVVVAGDGSERRALGRLAVEVGCEVTFLGRVEREHLPRLFARARLFALLSRPDVGGVGAEGFGLAALEAAAHGVPVVVSQTGGLPEAAGPGLILADPDDTAAAAARIRAWLDGPADPGAAHRAFVERHHGPERTVEALMRLREAIP